jgi:hypothetical protein
MVLALGQTKRPEKRIKSSKTDPHMYGTLVNDRGGLPDPWENKYSRMKKVIHTEKYETGSLRHTIHQN